MRSSWFGNMLVFETSDLRCTYGALLEEICVRGVETHPRGTHTREARPMVVRLTEPHKCVVKRPGMNRAYMWMEVTQYLAGEYDNELLARYSPKAAEMNNAFGFYGPRIGNQLVEIEHELRHDKDSRRGLAYIGRPEDLMYAKDLDMVCTLGWQFQRRGEALELQVFMRSWDLVWGLSYDIPAFVSMQLAMARALNLDVGTYTHVAGNGHVYDRHFDLTVDEGNYMLPCVGSYDGGMNGTREFARLVLAFERESPYGAITDKVLDDMPQWEPVITAWRKYGARTAAKQAAGS